jgi:hypothetical protein
MESRGCCCLRAEVLQLHLQEPLYPHL